MVMVMTDMNFLVISRGVYRFFPLLPSFSHRKIRISTAWSHATELIRIRMQYP